MEINIKTGSYLCVYIIPQQEAGHRREMKEHVVSELGSVEVRVWSFMYIHINKLDWIPCETNKTKTWKSPQTYFVFLFHHIHKSFFL